MSQSTAPEIVLEARGILKRYPGNVALNHVTFRARRNAVNVLIGENGAGKSTLMRILAGIETPDHGAMLLDGQSIRLHSPRDAFAHGIGIVHQELASLPNLDVCENIFAARELVRGGCFVDRAAEDRICVEALVQLCSGIAAADSMAQLSLGCRQLVELARAVAHGARIIILDEPTSALSTAEAETLLRVVTQLKHRGVTIIYISHRLHELLHIGDYFTVLRSGTVVGEASRSDVNRRWIVERMSGAQPQTDLQPSAAASVDTVLSVSSLSLRSASRNEAAQTPLFDIDLTLHHGEVLGIYGLLGAGRTELLESLAGLRRATGTVTLNGRGLALGSTTDAVRAGIVLVPEDRQREGLFPAMSILDNIALASSQGALLSRTDETARVRAIASELNLNTHDLDLPVTSLSGGNQQKVLLARCLLRSPVVLLLDEPTRGVDVTARQEIHLVLRKLAAQGMSILFASSEMEETRALADRVLVLRQGRIAASFSGTAITDEALFAAASPQLPNPAVTQRPSPTTEAVTSR